MLLFPCPINCVFVSTDNIRQERKGNYSKSSLQNKNNGPQNISLLHTHTVFSERVVFPRTGGFRGWMSWNNPWWWGCEAGERLIKTAGSLVSRNPRRGLVLPLVLFTHSNTFSPSELRWSWRMSCINLKAVGPADLISPQERHISDLFICGRALGGLFLLYLYSTHHSTKVMTESPEERETDT